MPNPRLAARYAKSLIDLSQEKGKLEAIYKDMAYLMELTKKSREFVNLLRSPIIKPDKKIKIVEAITKGKVGELTAAFNRLLIEKGRESNLPEIIAAYIEQYKRIKGIQTVMLTTAIPISNEVKQNFIQKLKQEKNIEIVDLKTEVNENIIGGFKLEIGDILVDASVAYDLDKVKTGFLNNDFIYRLR